jgi:hypothetical protein
MKLLQISSGVSGSRKRICKMAACKPKVLLSQLVDKVETRFQMLTPHFREFTISMELVLALSDVSGSQISKMPVCKPELLVSQLVYEILSIFDLCLTLDIAQCCNW